MDTAASGLAIGSASGSTASEVEVPDIEPANAWPLAPMGPRGVPRWRPHHRRWVEIHIPSVFSVETKHRSGVIWKAEADMRGGHHVQLGASDEDPKQFRAWCFPYGEFCWEGPDRDTIEEAVEGGRRHNPGYEPAGGCDLFG